MKRQKLKRPHRRTTHGGNIAAHRTGRNHDVESIDTGVDGAAMAAGPAAWNRDDDVAGIGGVVGV